MDGSVWFEPVSKNPKRAEVKLRETIMKTTTTLISLLLLSAVCATSASANFFTNSRWNVMLNIGSAPSPTPAQLRAIGDSSYANVPVRRGPVLQSENQVVAPPVIEDADKDVYSNGSYDAEIVGSATAVTKKMSSTKAVAAKKTIVAKSAAPAKRVSLASMKRKPVIGAKGEMLGHVLADNQQSDMIALQLPSGVAVSMPAMLATDKGNRLVAPTVTKADTLAMAKTQTGRTAALNVTMKNYTTRRYIRDRKSHVTDYIRNVGLSLTTEMQESADSRGASYAALP